MINMQFIFHLLDSEMMSIINKGDTMSRFTRFQKILLGLIAFFLVLILVSANKSNVNNIFYDPIEMLKYSVIDYPIDTIKGWLNDFNNLWKVKEENEHLRLQLSQVSQTTAFLQELQRENNELKQLMNPEMDQEFEKIYAKVITRNPEIYNNQLTINVGSDEGILLNMAVLSSKGLIGKIIEVNNHTSKVRLLTSQDQLSKVAVKIAIDEETSIEGYLEQYDLEKAAYRVRLFSDSERVEMDMNVITSGLGGVFPNGITVGKVLEVIELQSEKGSIVYVTPSVDFSDFEYVAVVNEVTP